MGSPVDAQYFCASGEGRLAGRPRTQTRMRAVAASSARTRDTARLIGELKKENITMVSLWPGAVKTETVGDHLARTCKFEA